MLSSKIKISGLLITALMNLKCIDFEMYNCIFCKQQALKCSV